MPGGFRHELASAVKRNVPPGTNHVLLARHVAGSETWVETHGYGRIVHEWSQKPSRPDNHWFDCLVGCAAAASMEGAKAPGHEAQERA